MFLTSLELTADVKERGLALMRARDHGLDTARVAVATVENTIDKSFEVGKFHFNIHVAFSDREALLDFVPIKRPFTVDYCYGDTFLCEASPSEYRVDGIRCLYLRHCA